MINLFFLFFLFFFIQAHAAEYYYLNDETLVLSGKINENEDVIFQSKINDKIKSVIFKNCSGGRIIESLKITKIIRKNKYNTSADGYVMSGCAFGFLGGVQRAISKNSKTTFLMFHGGIGSVSGNPVGVEKNLLALRLLNIHTSFNFTEPVTKIILNTKKSNEGIYFYANKNRAEYCDGHWWPLPNGNCNFLDDITLKSEKIITE